VQVITAPVHEGAAFKGRTDGPVFAAAMEAASAAFDHEAKVTGSGGTIPLLSALQQVAPEAEFIVWGASDENSQVHAANESVDLGEIAKMIVAEALLLEKLGTREETA
jgi:acetylornithine deacetylase/succinyl-diaminopimelate desuccinylase-like protein